MRGRTIDVLLVAGSVTAMLAILFSAREGSDAALPFTGVVVPVDVEGPPAPVASATVAPVPTAAPEVGWLLPTQEALSWSAVEPAPIPARAPADPGRGRALFAQLCSACHGEGGLGDGPLAAELPRRPRDLARGQIRTRRTHGRVTADELFRTITAGAPEFGMPSFARLAVEDRWALVGRVSELRRGHVVWGEPAPVELPPRPRFVDPDDAARTFRRTCAPCHGVAGDGHGVLAAGMLIDERGDPAPPAAFAHGPSAFRAGASEEAIVRTVLLGRAGTRMVALGLRDEDVWAVASHVARLAREGLAARRLAWSAFFERRRAASSFARGEARPPVERPWASSAATESAGRGGCISCHEGVAPIATGRMAVALHAVSAGDANTECTICHEGDPDAREKGAAHEGFVANPGSLWVTSLGLGCGKCHANRGALTSLQGVELPEPVGGRWLAVVSKRTDPTGASGSNHAYRIQRALMAQETGKIYLDTMEAGVVEPSAPRFTDFPIDDPDGPVPAAGSAAYKAFVARGLAEGHLARLERGEGLPTFEETLALTKKPEVAGFVDYFRKDCARCHLWGEGKDGRGEKRSSGCSACHVLSDDEGPTRHEIALAIPEEQCNHCHTRGYFTKHSEPHDRAGLGCVDCHTSIDVHGDGNLYASIRHQLEVRCEDCHGSREKAPWELPLGSGTKAASATPRGVAVVDGVEHLLTDRGNVRANWLREKGRVVVLSLATGEKHVAPLLGERLSVAPVASAGLAHGQAKHDALACSACHSGAAQRCQPCHLSYSRASEAQDYILSASNYDARTTRQRVVVTPGAGFSRDPLMAWGAPEMRPDERGRKRPQVAGCKVEFVYIGEDGQRIELEPRMNPRRPGYPPSVAPTLSHELSLKARECAECHGENGTVLPGDAGR